MKKLLLLTIGAGLSFGAFAQISAISTTKSTAPKAYKRNSSKVLAKTSAVYNDSILVTNGVSLSTDTPYLYPVGTDSGFVNGQSSYGFTGFAQRCDINSADSTVQVLGVFSLFAGTVNPASTNSVVFTAWTMGAPVPYTSTVSYSGYPDTVLATVTVPFTGLGVTDTSISYVAYFFPTPTAFLSNSFFVGYTVNYTWGATSGDTLSVMATDYRTEAVAGVSSGDTIINDQNMVYAGATTGWLDNGVDLGLDEEYYLFPIVTSSVTEGFKGVTKNNLTFFGNYPNPAVNTTNIKFSVAASADVTITITDMAGHIINTINAAGLGAGEHVIPVSTANMAAGDYLYLVRTAAGDGIASKLTVIK